jgi:hypothetical protein
VAKWSGWWEQRGFGRQAMHDLTLDVDPAGHVSGSGTDCIGPFTISGTLAAEVRLVKQYTGQHSILYVGTNSGEGIFGDWQFPGVPAIPGVTSGRFALFLPKDSSSDRAAIRELKPACCR